MAGSIKNVVWQLSRFHQAQLCLRQLPRFTSSSKASGTVESKTETKTKKEAAAEAPKPTSPIEPYTYEVPEYDDLLFYNVESDMAKYRIAQPIPGKP
ncbi:uncharacterized protein LOC117299316 [Asterias rubens]|uniref:uncharacterized protein LOC117299316 n=1 Tax=Asterias rubens TaxID=7604 RepID=UPI0014553EDE|nr:uncharacterized protein LOC117299316 [Asterias rubens]XP_033638722.1 uncharacterized protein LOC117299316 [Asterias rubens]